VVTSAPWDAFLSYIAVAEHAAARQFRLIADELFAQGQLQIAQRYVALAREEDGHYECVSRAYREFVAPRSRALDLYSGARASAGISVVERMAVAHFAHETAALAFFGHMHGHIHEQLDDPQWANELRQLCAGILRDEIQHVSDGKAFIARFLEGQSQAVQTQVRSAVQLHRNFTIRTVRRLFRNNGAHPFAEAMIANYDRLYRAATAGVL
jgi:hypothetical protein